MSIFCCAIVNGPGRKLTCSVIYHITKIVQRTYLACWNTSKSPPALFASPHFIFNRVISSADWASFCLYPSSSSSISSHIWKVAGSMQKNLLPSKPYQLHLSSAANQLLAFEYEPKVAITTLEMKLHYQLLFTKEQHFLKLCILLSWLLFRKISNIIFLLQICFQLLNSSLEI